MSELISIHVHAPPMTSSASSTDTSPAALHGPSFVVGGVPAAAAVAAAAAGGGGRLTRLKKVENRTVDGRTLPSSTFGHVPKRHPIDLEFKDLIYSVKEGRNKGMAHIAGMHAS